MEMPHAFPRIIQFDIPGISSWPPEMQQHVVARLSAKPSLDWNSAFHAELARSDADIREAMPVLEADRISFLALPRNIGTLRRKLRSLLTQIDHRTTKARRKSQRLASVRLPAQTEVAETPAPADENALDD